MIIVYVLTTHNLFAPDFILLRPKNLNKDIKFIEKFYFILHAVSSRRLSPVDNPATITTFLTETAITH